SGVIRTTMAIAVKLSTIAISAGSTAAVKRSKMNVWVAMQYSTMTIDGGMSDLSVPPAAIVPVENAGEYPRCNISGSATLANVAAVAVEDPHMTPKAADPPIVA